MPYRWEVRENDQWTAMPDNEAIERDYCDPSKTNRYSLLTFSGRLAQRKNCKQVQTGWVQ